MNNAKIISDSDEWRFVWLQSVKSREKKVVTPWLTLDKLEVANRAAIGTICNVV